MKCPNCQMENTADPEYCTQCGGKLPKKRQPWKSWIFPKMLIISVVVFSFPWMAIFLLMLAASVFDPIGDTWWNATNLEMIRGVFIIFALPGLILVVVCSLLYFLYPSSRWVPRRTSTQQKGQFDVKRLFVLIAVLFVVWIYLNTSIFTYLPNYSLNDGKCDFCGLPAVYTSGLGSQEIHELCGFHGFSYIVLHPWIGLEFLFNISKTGNYDIIGPHLLVLYWGLLTWWVVIGLVVIISRFDDEKI